MLLPVRPDVEGRPDAVHRGLRHPRRVRHGTAAPVRASAGRLALERLPQQRRDLVVSDGARPSRPAFVVQAREPLRPEALAPLADRPAAGADPLGDLLVAHPFGARKHDLGAPHEPGGQTARTRERLEFLAGALTDFERLQRTSPGHGPLLDLGWMRRYDAPSPPSCQHYLQDTTLGGRIMSSVVSAL